MSGRGWPTHEGLAGDRADHGRQLPHRHYRPRPTNYSSFYWRQCLAGDAPPPPLLHRPARTGLTATQAGSSGKRSGMDEQEFRQEYPSTWEDALYWRRRVRLRSSDSRRPRGTAATHVPGDEKQRSPLAISPGSRKYVKAWDIGPRHKDAAVGIVLDVTEDVHDVVATAAPRPHLSPDSARDRRRCTTPTQATTAIEDNAAGQAVRKPRAPQSPADRLHDQPQLEGADHPAIEDRDPELADPVGRDACPSSTRRCAATNSPMTTSCKTRS